MKTSLILVPAALLLTPLLARADLTIETKNGDETQIVYLAPHMLSTVGANGGAIFRGDKKVLYAIDPVERSYREITEKDARALQSKVDDALAEVQEAMRNLSPEQRATVETLMKEELATAAPEGKRTVTAIGEKKRINGFDCKGFAVTRDNGASIEVWAADPKSARLKPEDLRGLRDLGEFMSVMTPQLGGVSEMIKDYEHPRKSDVPGLPILTIHRDKDGNETGRVEVVKIDRGNVSAEHFEVPPGYYK